MAKISWDSTSIANYFSNFLGGLKNTSCSSIYNSLGDHNLIKSGKYKKLVSAYYDKLEKDQASESVSDKNASDKAENKKENNTSKKRKSALDTEMFHVTTPKKDAIALDTKKFTSGTTNVKTATVGSTNEKTATAGSTAGTKFDTTI